MSGILKKIFSNTGQQLAETVGNVLDNLTTTNEEKSLAKERITQVVNNSLDKLMELQAAVMTTEMQGNWLQRSWRPIVMLTFVVLLILRWMGFTQNVDLQMELKLMDLIELGLGGYVIGRSVEKVADTVTKNVDMPFLKKKDRA